MKYLIKRPLSPQAMDSPAAATFLDSAWSMIEDFIKSENGKRFMKLVCADLK